MSDFQREERYIVVKLKHLTASEEQDVRHFLANGQIQTQECVVVEPDWPNYEATWAAIRQIEEGTYDPDENANLRKRLAEAEARIQALEEDNLHQRSRRNAARDCIEKMRANATINTGGVSRKDLENMAEEYVEGYEFRGDDGDYQPNERERFLITDCVIGLVDEINQKLRASQGQSALPGRLVELASEAMSDAAASAQEGGEFLPEEWAKIVMSLNTDTPKQPLSFQQRVDPWMQECFGKEISANFTERNHRFLEEALELVQALGCTRHEAMQLVDYVYGRPVGDPPQEVGGVRVTLSALCNAMKINEDEAAETELARVWTKVPQIRAKQAAKPKHSPLPQRVTQPDVKSDQEGFEKCLSDQGIASNYQGDGIYGGTTNRLYTFFLAGADHAREQQARTSNNVGVS